MLVADDSKWVRDLAQHPQFSGVRHYLMVSMDDVIEVIAKPAVDADWISPNDV
jgi:hypothetical protein